jgi:hypothetical protein
MKMTGWLFYRFHQYSLPAGIRRIAGGFGAVLLLAAPGISVAQAAVPAAQGPAPDTQPVAPKGYTLHESIDMGGHIAGVAGSGAMYDTMVNLHSGPRVLGETFELRALPGAKGAIVDALSAFSNGWGGDPDNFARMDFYKGKLFEFSGMFRRDRQYFDYDLLGNPNIPSGQSIPIGPAGAQTGSYAWPQLEQSPFLYNTVRRMTDTSVTLLPLSKVSFRAGYSGNIFEGPSLSPSGYQVAGAYILLLQEMQRNGSDDFFGAIDWKPVRGTRVTFEERVDHYKADSSFNMDPSYFTVEEADGSKAALLSNYDSLTPYSSASCNPNSIGAAPVLSAPQSPGGLPVVNPACNVVTSYFRSQPTRILYPTEIFRLQSSTLRNVSMNGDVRYTDANMSLPHYYENFQGLAGTTRSQSYTATASAHREVTAVDYGINWQATQKIGLSDQLTFSNVQQPGTATMTSGTTVSTPATAGNETITYAGTLITTSAAAGKSSIEGSGAIGTPLPDFFGQKVVTNDVTASWDGWSRATVSLTYRDRKHTVAEGIPHDTLLAAGSTTGGTVTINQNGGVLNLALRPTGNLNIEGSVEVLYADNVFTPVAPRELQHYRVHALFRPKPWATLNGAWNDMELHNNTNNQGTSSTDALDGPLNHTAHTRIFSVGADLAPNQHYGLNFDYAYTDVYTATSICYDAAASATLPGAATPGGTLCPGAAVRGATYYEFGPVKDFMDAPTQSGSVAITLSPVTRLRSNVGYLISSVDGSRFYNDARDVAGSLVSTWQTPFVNLAWTVHPGWIWNAEYKFYGYGEGGPSGAQYCATSNPTAAAAAPVVSCNSSTLAGLQTGVTISPVGETAPRNFHGNVATLGFHYEF